MLRAFRMTVLVLAIAQPFVGARAFAQSAQGGSTTQVQRACRGDYLKLCNGIKPGEGRVAACFREKQAGLSTECRAALEKLQGSK